MTMQTFRNPAGFGGALFLATVPVHLALSRDASVALAAVTLALIGGAYIGFGARAETPRTFLMELSVAILFGAAALLGLVWHWSALAIGLGLHGLWDLLLIVVLMSVDGAS